MGADRVLLRSAGDSNVHSILSSAADFFKSFFHSTAPRKLEDIKVERGAWLRLYGVPLHAWNDYFFRLCSMDVGRFLRVDNCTADKERLDYARILVATPSLNIINDDIEILVDDMVLTVKIVEEWGLSIGEDVCLFEEESTCDESERMEVPGDLGVNNDVEVLLNEIEQDFLVQEQDRIMEIEQQQTLKR